MNRIVLNLKRRRLFAGVVVIVAVVFLIFSATAYDADAACATDTECVLGQACRTSDGVCVPRLESGIPGVGAGGAQHAPLPSLSTYINYLYIFVLSFVGIAGFISLVIWGTVWVGSAVVDKKAMALESIKNTLIGIGIALTAFIMLYTINPDLTVINIPKIEPIKYPVTKTLIKQPPRSLNDGAVCFSNIQCFVGSTCSTMGKCARSEEALGRSTGWVKLGEPRCKQFDGDQEQCTLEGCGWCTTRGGGRCTSAPTCN